MVGAFEELGWSMPGKKRKGMNVAIWCGVEILARVKWKMKTTFKMSNFLRIRISWKLSFELIVRVLKFLGGDCKPKFKPNNPSYFVGAEEDMVHAFDLHLLIFFTFKFEIQKSFYVVKYWYFAAFAEQQKKIHGSSLQEKWWRCAHTLSVMKKLFGFQ